MTDPNSRPRPERSGGTLLRRIAGRTRAVRMPRGKLARRATGTLAFVVALSATGLVYSAFAPSGNAEDSASSAANVRKGQQLFDQTCITCHGANLQGVKDRGPSLIGVGQAAAYFQLRTGRMPLVQQGPEATRKKAVFSETEIEQIAAFIQEHGGGPQVPQGNLRDDKAMGAGGELFRLNCASCHNFAGKGGALSGGKFAPNLKYATDQEMYAAMLSGPESMPVFGDNQITPDQKRAIISYVQGLKAQADPGGNGIGRLGPVPEGLVIWIVGIGLMLFIILWIGQKAGARGPAHATAGHTDHGSDTDPSGGSSE
jgi:ubiquinol-cytochrome c reductase cytochrome c subunit